MRLPLIFCAFACLALAQDYQWNLPKGFPKPFVPADNPMSAAKVELGRYLFYDKRMSVNGTESCASCHKQELAFTDGRATGLGATGESHSRSAMSLVNVAWSGALTWSNPDMRSLEKQALVPMFGARPVELGLRQDDRFLPTIRGDAKVRELFAKAFPGETDPFTIDNVTRAIASFERSIVSARSPLRPLPLLPRGRWYFGIGKAWRGSVLRRTAIVLPLPRRIQFHRFHSVGTGAESAHRVSQHGALQPVSSAERGHLRIHEAPRRHG